jgi:uncharacterized protein (TIGR00730 family)
MDVATPSTRSDSVRTICVYCGSHIGNDPAYAVAARELGRAIAERGIALVYGGAKVGLMGMVADTVLAAGGRVVGVMPQHLVDREIAHRTLSDLHIVTTMHERKQRMIDLADAFVMMPGGFGSWDEFCEAVTWSMLGLHGKSCGILNTNDYYAPFFEMIERAVRDGFVRPATRDAIIVAAHADELLERLVSTPPIPRAGNSTAPTTP